nr:FAD-dependent oxidoreductase [Desulfobulbaceae bacterium]
MGTEYQAEFMERIERTPAANSYRFKMSAGLKFTAGQYMMVDLGRELVHPLSLSDCPEESRFIEFTKRMTGSEYCKRLESLKKGEMISVKGPEGKFGLTETDGNIIMIAGGIGITPIRSILKSLEKKKGETPGVVLIYGNNNKDDIAFREELENLQLFDYKLVHVLEDNSGMEKTDKGYITAEIIARELTVMRSPVHMISGPPSIVKATKEALAALDVPEELIRTDIFIGYN